MSPAESHALRHADELPRRRGGASVAPVDRLLQEQAKIKDHLFPMEQEALHRGMEAFADLHERMERGEDLVLRPFIDVLEEMKDAIVSAPEGRWMETSSAIKHLLGEINEDGGCHGIKAKLAKPWLREGWSRLQAAHAAERASGQAKPRTKANNEIET